MSLETKDRGDEIEYRQATEKDIAGFLALYEGIFDPEKAHREWFQWQYIELSDLADDNISVVVAVVDDRVIGAVGYLGIMFQEPNGNRFLGIQPVNVMVDPDYRGRSIFSQIVKRARKMIYPSGDWIEFGYPNEIALPIWTSKHQWELVRDEPKSRPIRLQHPTQFAVRSKDSNLLKKIVSVGDLPFLGYLRVIDSIHTGTNTYEYQVTTHEKPPTELLSQLYQQAVPDQIHLVRSQQFYETRLSGPHSEYTTYIAEKKGEPTAAIVVAKPYHRNYAHVIEALPLTQRSPQITNALRTALREVIDDNKHLYGIEWSPALPEEFLKDFGFHTSEGVEKILDKLSIGGFFPSVQKENFCIRTEECSNLDVDVMKIDNWLKSNIERDF